MADLSINALSSGGPPLPSQATEGKPSPILRFQDPLRREISQTRLSTKELSHVTALRSGTSHSLIAFTHGYPHLKRWESGTGVEDLSSDRIESLSALQRLDFERPKIGLMGATCQHLIYSGDLATKERLVCEDQGGKRLILESVKQMRGITAGGLDWLLLKMKREPSFAETVIGDLPTGGWLPLPPLRNERSELSYSLFSKAAGSPSAWKRCPQFMDKYLWMETCVTAGEPMLVGAQLKSSLGQRAGNHCIDVLTLQDGWWIKLASFTPFGSLAGKLQLGTLQCGAETFLVARNLIGKVWVRGLTSNREWLLPRPSGQRVLSSDFDENLSLLCSAVESDGELLFTLGHGNGVHQWTLPRDGGDACYEMQRTLEFGSVKARPVALGAEDGLLVEEWECKGAIYTARHLLDGASFPERAKKREGSLLATIALLFATAIAYGATSYYRPWDGSLALFGSTSLYTARLAFNKTAEPFNQRRDAAVLPLFAACFLSGISYFRSVASHGPFERLALSRLATTAALSLASAHWVVWPWLDNRLLDLGEPTYVVTAPKS